MEDFFNNVPDIVIDKILEKLPIQMAAQTSVLSKQWNYAWLSMTSLVFNDAFWKEQTDESGNSDWRNGSRIISDILLNHNGPIHELNLYIPAKAFDQMNHSKWISFLSKTVKKIVINNSSTRMDITSHIFRCSKLVHLEISNLNINPPPTDFIGFPHLKHLTLVSVEFSNPSIFCGLIENCRRLLTLEVRGWIYKFHAVIDAPNLRTLILDSDFEGLVFRNVRSLEHVTVCLGTIPPLRTVEGLKLLASSCQVRVIHFDGELCKFLATGGFKESPSVIFNHLDRLRLTGLELDHFDVLRGVLAMIRRCPYIKKLDIIAGLRFSEFQTLSVTLNFNSKYKLEQLREINIEGITGSSAELKLVEYLLAISPTLENLYFKSCSGININSQQNMSRALMRFPRASTKASLVCLDASE